MKTHAMTLKLGSILFLTVVLAACGNTGDFAGSEHSEVADYEEGMSLDLDLGLDDHLRSDFGGDHTGLAAVKPYCSNLSFSGVTWNKSLTDYERRSLAIALSLSGSFEGHNGWKNLTNNFDGMGLSAGLLNQTLGTDSLQPLLINLKSRAPAAYNKIASARRTSLFGMLSAWQNAKGYKVPSFSSKLMFHEEDPVVTSSSLDIPEEDEYHLQGKIEIAATPASNSVSWAKSNLYLSSGNFKTEWKNELSALMEHPDYVSEQIFAGEVIHRRALGYVKRLGFSSLRSYLFMFDIGVQNGGFKESEFVELETAIRKEGLKSETVILKRLLDIRLRRVLAQWRNDVKIRKTAVIDGSGTVHGSKRDFTKQYCYGLLDPIL